jgi:hypothetical protein
MATRMSLSKRSNTDSEGEWIVHTCWRKKGRVRDEGRVDYLPRQMVHFVGAATFTMVHLCLRWACLVCFVLGIYIYISISIYISIYEYQYINIIDICVDVCRTTVRL